MICGAILPPHGDYSSWGSGSWNSDSSWYSWGSSSWYSSSYSGSWNSDSSWYASSSWSDLSHYGHADSWYSNPQYWGSSYSGSYSSSAPQYWGGSYSDWYSSRALHWGNGHYEHNDYWYSNPQYWGSSYSGWYSSSALHWDNSWSNSQWGNSWYGQSQSQSHPNWVSEAAQAIIEEMQHQNRPGAAAPKTPPMPPFPDSELQTDRHYLTWEEACKTYDKVPYTPTGDEDDKPKKSVTKPQSNTDGTSSSSDSHSDSSGSGTVVKAAPRHGSSSAWSSIDFDRYRRFCKLYTLSVCDLDSASDSNSDAESGPVMSNPDLSLLDRMSAPPKAAPAQLCSSSPKRGLLGCSLKPSPDPLAQPKAHKRRALPKPVGKSWPNSQ